MAKKKIKKKEVKKQKVVKKAIVKNSTRKRKPAKTTIVKLKNSVEEKLRELRKKEKPFVRYSFHINSIKVDANNILEEVIYDYRGVLVIPKSQKDNYKAGNVSVTGVYILSNGLKWNGSNKDMSKVSKSDVINLLKDNIREGYIDSMKETIEKELMPEFKIINDLPWKY